jgi:hypothetical protein
VIFEIKHDGDLTNFRNDCIWCGKLFGVEIEGILVAFTRHLERTVFMQVQFRNSDYSIDIYTANNKTEHL